MGTTLPTSPDGTDWGIYGDSPKEQWEGLEYEAERENAEKDVDEACRLLKEELEGPVGREISRILKAEEVSPR